MFGLALTSSGLLAVGATILAYAGKHIRSPLHDRGPSPRSERLRHGQP